ncbi:glycerophosphodiester phosphodiesterase family protein [Cohnella sp. WQ 127256]|uniref:glycerophosphodiester phosphodiesterase n=1 Tax=Cohnella sp. WQ 127256 TaxID=2938790 RepID=UPI002117F36A|nr:glycerophosphodiester phosphodiesterase family protein [Cohnella sp. WQ 127256]
MMDKNTRAKLHPCVAHRGFSGMAPENTMAAFRLAMSQPDVKWIELDVHLSRDGVPVVIHDGTLKRTANIEGRVIDFTATELGRLDVGSWFNPSFSKEGIPTLDEVLALTKGKCALNVELKGDDSDPEQLAQRAVDIIRSHQLEHDIVITSFHPNILRAVHRCAPALKTGLIIDDNPKDLVESLIALNASYLSIGFRHINEQLLKQTSEASIDVMAWTVNSDGDLRRLASRPEAFQLCTNYPDRWLTAIKEGE